MVNRRQRYLQFVFKQLDVFQKNLNISVANADIDAVHDMRVAVKKLRAAHLLAARLDKNDLLLPDLKKIKTLYRISGQLRDLQLKKALVEKNFRSNLHSPVFVFIDRQLTHHRCRYIELAQASRFDYFKEWAFNTKYLLAGRKESEFNLVIQQQISAHMHEARELFSQASCIRDYHLSRRLIKQVLHLMIMTGMSSWSDTSAHLTRRRLKTLEESLGNWHDHVQMSLWLSEIHQGVAIPTWEKLQLHFHRKSERMLQLAADKFIRIAGVYTT